MSRSPFTCEPHNERNTGIGLKSKVHPLRRVLIRRLSREVVCAAATEICCRRKRKDADGRSLCGIIRIEWGQRSASSSPNVECEVARREFRGHNHCCSISKHMSCPGLTSLIFDGIVNDLRWSEVQGKRDFGVSTFHPNRFERSRLLRFASGFLSSRFG